MVRQAVSACPDHHLCLFDHLVIFVFPGWGLRTTCPDGKSSETKLYLEVARAAETIPDDRRRTVFTLKWQRGGRTASCRRQLQVAAGGNVRGLPYASRSSQPKNATFRPGYIQTAHRCAVSEGVNRLGERERERVAGQRPQVS